MPRTLILTRHAKSSWDNPSPSDHARPLNKRGRKSAAAIGAWLKEKGRLPDELLSSSSVRTRETWERMGLKAEKLTFSDDGQTCTTPRLIECSGFCPRQPGKPC